MTTRIIANGTSTEVRRNLVNNPAFRVDASGWVGAGGSGAQVSLERQGIATPNPSGAGSWLRCTVTAAGTYFRVRANTDVDTITPGHTYTLSAWVRTIPSDSDTRMMISWWDASNTAIYENTSPPLPTTGNWTRISVTAVAPPNASRAQVSARSDGSKVGEILDIAGVLFEKAPQVGDYFDGTASPDPDLVPSWTGAANASPSILTGPDSTQPILVTGYEATRQGRSTVHDLIGGGIAVALATPRPRAGTLELLYADEDEAFHALNMHALETTFTMFDTDRAGVAMTYTAGTATITLDDTTRRMWLVKVDFQEVQQ